MTTISSNSGSIQLTSASYTNPVSIVSGVTVSGGYYGIFGTTQAWTIDNSGLVHGHQGDSGTFAYGIELKAGGDITNSDTGTISATATSATGVYVSGGTATVLNQGTISATGYGVVLRAGGSITNAAGGRIYGTNDAIDLAGGGGMVTNYGSIVSASGFGVNMTAAAGTIANHASGQIAGADGVILGGGASDVSNAGTIRGNFQGVQVAAAHASISNTGEIIVASMAESPAVLTMAISAKAAASYINIDNMDGGTISCLSGIGIDIAQGVSAASITNQGLITASSAGILLNADNNADIINQDGGTIGATYAINLIGGTTDMLDNVGSVMGSAIGVDIGAADSTITNSGMIVAKAISGLRVAISGGVAATDLVIDNLAGGAIYALQGIGIEIAASGASITNDGVISGGEPGIVVNASLTSVDITNDATGTISGQYGIYLGASDSTITNHGSIGGTFVGIMAGSLASQAIIANQGGGTISGGVAGIKLEATGDTINNSGLIGEGATFGIYAVGATDLVVINAASGTISGLAGIVTTGDNATITNFGEVMAGGAHPEPNYDAVFAGGANDTITNSGTLIANEGAVVVVEGTAAVITNATGGVMNGYQGIYVLTTGAVITNQGLIESSATANNFAGVDIGSAATGATITNDVGATISGFEGVFIGAADSTLMNAGVIDTTADGHYGVFGTITATQLQVDNAVGATISGAGGVGLYANGDTLVNRGVILSTGTANVSGVYAQNSAANVLIENLATGTISALTGSGIYMTANASTIVNDGVIEGGPGSAGTYVAGIYTTTYATGLEIMNHAGATISGDTGVYLSGANSTITNEGQILGGTLAATEGVDLGTYATYAVLTNGVGATIAGLNGIYVYGDQDTIINQGVISAIGPGDQAGVNINGAAANITNGSDGTISGLQGIVVGADGGIVGNYGKITGTLLGLDVNNIDGLVITNGVDASIVGGTGISMIGGDDVTITNQGSILGTGLGILAQPADGLVVDNEAGAVISGFYGVLVEGTGDIITNSGQIVGQGGAGIYSSGGDSLVINNLAAGTLSGGTNGISLYVTNGIITNAGQIVGTAGHGIFEDSGSGGEARVEPKVGAFLTIDNMAGGTISGATTGVYVNASYSSMITNAAGALITGQSVGVYMSGTLINAGTIVGAGGTAVAFADGVSSLLVIDPGAVFTGQVDGGSTGSAVELAAGGVGTFDGLGVSFTNFDMVTVDAGAAWFITGAADTLGVGSTLAIDGLTDLNQANLQDAGTVVNSYLFELQASTLAAASLYGTGTTQLQNGSTLSVQGVVGAGQIVQFAAPDTGARLVLGTGADMAGTISNFGTFDVIDVANLAFSAGNTTATVTGNVMTVTNGSVTDTFATAGLADGTMLFSYADGTGGTDVILGAAQPPTDLTLAPASDSGVKGDDITNDTTPTITGTGVAGDTVILYDGATAVGTGTVADNGTWAIVTSTLSAGQQVLTATERLGGGPASPASTALTLTIDTAIPAAPAALTLAPGSDSGVKGDNITNVTTPDITGTGIAGDTIILYDGSTAVGTGTVADDGTWAIATSTLTAGAQVLTATQSDVADNVSGPSSTLTLTIDTTIPPPPAALALSPGSDTGVVGDDITKDTTPTITGTGIAGDTIILYDGATVVGTGTVADDGTWAIATSTLSAGAQVLTATQSDVADNVSGPSSTLTLTIDTTIPPPPAALALSPGSDTGVVGDDITKDTTPTITGTGIAGDTIILYDGATVVGTGTVADDGTWAIATSTLSAGAQVLTATQSDVADNVSGPSSTLTLTIDTTVPPPPAALTLSPGSDTGVLGDDITKDTTPTITGTGIAGDKIILYDGASVVGTGTVGDDGTWAIATSTLTAGAQVLTATQTDVADNVSGPSSTLTLTIDTAIPPPPAALTLSPGSDTGVLGDDITKDTTPTITGTGIAGDKITLYDGESVVGTGTVAENGTWAIATSTLSAGEQVLIATQSDVADNVSGPSSALTLTIDTTIPPPPASLTLAPASDSGTAGDDITDHDRPVITGTGIAGETITLYDGQSVVGYATVASNGTWSVATTTALAIGLNELTATQTDVAGNVSPASAALALTIVPVPTVPTITDPSTDTQPGEPVLAGAAPDNSLVTLYQDGILLGTARATASGAWTFTYGSPLSAGSYAITATATDAAGDVTALSAPLALQVSATGGYTIVLPPNLAGDVVSRIHDNTGLLVEVDTRNSAQQLLQSVTNTTAILEIYDNSGKLIGTVTQPSSSAESQPAFATERGLLSANTASGPVGSVIDFLSESNVITTQGNDTVIAGPGADTIFAAGASCLVNGGAGSLFYVGGAGSTTVTGGTGSATVFGGGGGGHIAGGSAGYNVLVAGGGATTVLGGGAHDVLAGGSGTGVLAMDAGGEAFGGTGTSAMFGAAGGILVGGSGANAIIGGAGSEALWGGTGNSTLFGGTGAETLGGGAGNTTLLGGAGTTTFVGGTGNSTMWGGAGDTTVFGGTGAARVHLGAGFDQVAFGDGSMSVTSGSGTDLYDMTNGFSSNGNDEIAGFKVGTDQLRLFGYSQQQVQETVSGGSTIFSLDDGTTLTLAGVTALSSTSVVFG